MSPEIDQNEVLFLRPLLACRSLKFLHWDCLNSGSAETHLANSILEGGFPNLKYIRAPCDGNGTLQSVCRPRERIELAGDKFRSLIIRQTPPSHRRNRGSSVSTTHHAPPTRPSSSRHSRTTSSSSSLQSPTTRAADAEELTRHLPTARIKAQKRLESAQHPQQNHHQQHHQTPPPLPPPAMPQSHQRPKTPRGHKQSNASSSLDFVPPNMATFHITIIVTNTDSSSSKHGGPPKEIVTYHGYLGTMGSKVEYYLLPDIPNSEAALAGLGDIMEAGWEWRDANNNNNSNGGGSSSGNGGGGVTPSEGCTGLANVKSAISNGGNARAMQKYWSHKERIPWRRINLDVLF